MTRAKPTEPTTIILKILDGALRHDPKKAYDAGVELAAALEGAGRQGAASRLRARLERAPATVTRPVLAAHQKAPVSRDSGMTMLDEAKPASGQMAGLILSSTARAEVEEFVAEVRAHDELADAGVADPCRLLIQGPPGVGKTSIAAAVAGDLGVRLLTLRCDGLMSSLLGSTGANLRMVFEHAASEPCVLLLDELDAIARSRDSKSKDVGEMHRVVISLLQCLDALPDETVVVGATNHADLLDPAIWRRFPRKLTLQLPDLDERRELWRQALGSYLTLTGSEDDLARRSEGLSHADIKTSARQSVRRAILKGLKEVDVAETLARVAAQAICDSNEAAACKEESPR